MTLTNISKHCQLGHKAETINQTNFREHSYKVFSYCGSRAAILSILFAKESGNAQDI